MSISKYLTVIALGGICVHVFLLSISRDDTPVNAEDKKHGGNIVFEVKKNKQKLPHTLFSHQDHLDAGHTCKDCHNDTVFKAEQKLGVNKFTMKDIIQRKACGACHNGRKLVKGKAVFAPQKNCSRCHSTKFRKRAR